MKIYFLILFIFVGAVSINAQSLTIFNASHDYSITKIEISVRYSEYLLKVTEKEEDIIWDKGFTNERSVAPRSTIIFPEITKGGYFLKITWGNNIVLKRFIKITKNIKLNVGSQNETDDWK